MQEDGALEANSAPGTRNRRGFGGSRPLDEDEIRDCLERNWWGVLSTLGEEYPYAVPVVYGSDGEHFYIASRAGQKVENIKVRSGVCLNVIEVEDLSRQWTSVLVTGQAELISEPRGHLTAILALQRQARRVGPMTAKDISRMAAARVIRISPAAITGRTRCK